MGKSECIYIPFVGDKPSELYKGLLELTGKNRPLANYLYASYLSNGVAGAMNSAGFKVNAQNEHSANDVFKFFKGNELIQDTLNVNLALSASTGFITKGTLTDFSAEEAYQKANEFNQAHPAKLAYVIQHDKAFNVVIVNRDSSTLSKLSDLNYQNILWQEFKSEAVKQGINLDTLIQSNPSLINPIRLLDYFRVMNSLTFVDPQNLTKEDISNILAASSTFAQTQRLTSRFGNAEEIYDKLHDNSNLGNAAKTALVNLLTASRDNAVSNIKAIHNNLAGRVDLKYADSYTTKIEKTLQKLNKEFNISSGVIKKTSNEITQLSDAVIETIYSLQRQIDTLKSRGSDESKITELQATKEKLTESLNGKKGYAGLLEFLNKAVGYIETVDTRLNATYTGDEFTQLRDMAKNLSAERNLMAAYYNVVSSLANIDSLIIDTNLTSEEREILRKEAIKVRDLLDDQKKLSASKAKQGMVQLCQLVFGNDSSNAAAIGNIIEMADTQTGIMDQFYSFGRASNPLVAALGSIVQDAQDRRNENLKKITKRVREASYKLKKSGSDSSFMYAEDGTHIISIYDWKKYNKELAKAKMSLQDLGLYGVELKLALQEWEDEHTTGLVVDKVSGRTERVPIFTNQDALAHLTTAQREYYDTMLEIMGELGTLLPSKYQDVFKAPQIEKGMYQIIVDGIKGKHSGNTPTEKLLTTVGLILDRLKLKRRANDTELRSKGDFDDTEKLMIPILYWKKLENKDNLLNNYTMAVAQYASSALNFAAMSEIEDIASMAQDYIQGLGSASSREEIKAVDHSDKTALTIIKPLKNTYDFIDAGKLVESFVAAQIYGVRNVSELPESVLKFGQALIGYTSWSGLTFNVLGGTSNYLVGEAQMMIETAARDYYNVKDYLRAHAIVIGDQTLGLPGNFMDTLTGNLSSKTHLISEMFDPEQEGFMNNKRMRYYKDPFRQLFGSFNSQFIYGMGESVLHSINMYGVLCHEKVMYKGKEVSLYDVLETTEKINGQKSLKIKDGAVRLDGGKIDDDYIAQIRRRVKSVNQNTHGAMNIEDKGIIHQRLFGRLIMNFRQWMVEHLSRRFRGKHYDASKRDISLTNFYFGRKVKINGKKVDLYDAFNRVDAGKGDGTFILTLKDGVTDLKGNTLTDSDIDTMLEKYKSQQGWTEGYYTTAMNLVLALWKGRNNLNTEMVAYWNNLSEGQKQNLKRVLGEFNVICALYGLQAILGETEDSKKKWWKRFWIYQIKRLLVEETAFTPFFPAEMSKNVLTVLNKPIPSSNTAMRLLYPFTLDHLSEFNEEVKSGRHKGENKWWYHFKKYDLPGYNQIDNLIHLDEEDNVFLPFK